MTRTILLLLVLTSTAWAQTLVIENHEVPYTLVDGKQMVKRADLAPVFPDMAGQEGTVDVATLADHPDARVTKRDGLITRIKYYNRAAAAIYQGVRGDAPPPNGETAPAATSPIKMSVSGRKKTSSPVPDHDAHIFSVTVTNNSDQPLSLSAREFYVVDETGGQHRCETGATLQIAPGAGGRLDNLTFNVPKRNTVVSIHLQSLASANL